jgi:hypothetical protein
VSRQTLLVAEVPNWYFGSRVTTRAELNEIAQYGFEYTYGSGHGSKHHGQEFIKTLQTKLNIRHLHCPFPFSVFILHSLNQKVERRWFGSSPSQPGIGRPSRAAQGLALNAHSESELSPLPPNCSSPTPMHGLLSSLQLPARPHRFSHPTASNLSRPSSWYTASL